MTTWIKDSDDPPIFHSSRGTVWKGDPDDGEDPSKWYWSLLDSQIHGPVETKKEAQDAVVASEEGDLE
jgi:hypothetical protein